ncbi:MAG: sigma-54-dependent Fis family transcriptional regulator [Desulfobacteraceae bacterium]|nr:sigma-54-dependent Fis family transcriptional regulator [Desulfobacteraceae bacterium]
MLKRGRILSTEQMNREIKNSHERSKRYGISREKRSPDQKKLSATALRDRKSANKALLNPVVDYIEEFYDLLSPEKFIIALVDREGYILHFAGNDEIVTEFAHDNCAPGYCWTEKEVGTTAISLSLEKQVSIQLNDKDHYCKLAHGFTSCAAPIFGYEDKLHGVLVVSGKSDRVHRHTLVMVTSAAQSIEKQMHLLMQHKEMSVYTGFLDSVVESAETGLLVLDRQMRIWKTNRKGNEILGDNNLEGQAASVLKGLDPDLEDIWKKPQAWKGKEADIRYGNRRIPILFSAQPVISDENRLLGAVLVFEEIENIWNMAKQITGPKAYFTFDHLIGNSGIFLDALALAKRAALSDSTVLLLGETGTGKELFAQAIHNAGVSKDQPFIPINCGAIPGELIESELFGYVDGAFTGALKGGRAGKFELANNGTILLDEIGDMPHDMQVKLLRVLQTGEIQRIGAQKILKATPRVIASTHVDLPQAIRFNKFRQDLYYRLNILSITIPPLRQRGAEDIIALARYFLGKNRQGASLTPGAIDALIAYDWPGNARELGNTIQRALHISDGGIVRQKHLGLTEESCGNPPLPSGSLGEMEQKMIASALDNTGANMAAAAKQLGISRSTLYRKVKKYGMGLTNTVSF